jgi:hypothetical protein
MRPSNGSFDRRIFILCTVISWASGRVEAGTRAGNKSRGVAGRGATPTTSHTLATLLFDDHEGDMGLNLCESEGTTERARPYPAPDPHGIAPARKHVEVRLTRGRLRQQGDVITRGA